MAKLLEEDAIRAPAIRLEARRLKRSEHNRAATKMRRALFPYTLGKGPPQRDTLDVYQQTTIGTDLRRPRGALGQGLSTGPEDSQYTGESSRCAELPSEQK